MPRSIFSSRRTIGWAAAIIRSPTSPPIHGPAIASATALAGVRFRRSIVGSAPSPHGPLWHARTSGSPPPPQSTARRAPLRTPSRSTAFSAGLPLPSDPTGNSPSAAVEARLPLFQECPYRLAAIVGKDTAHHVRGLDLEALLKRHRFSEVEVPLDKPIGQRSEEHTSELQSLMRISYAVFCLKKKKTNKQR